MSNDKPQEWLPFDINKAYKILGLKPGASGEEVKQAYRQMAKIWHPDSILEPEKKLKAEEKIKEINQAYEKLKFYQPSKTNHSGHQSTSTSIKIDSIPSNAERFYNQGMENEKQGKYSEAIADFTQAIRWNSNYVEAYKFRGLICSKLGYENRAKSDLKKARELELEFKLKKAQPKPTSPPTPPNKQHKNDDTP
ncbi:J domain-containing protein [Cylindrospermum sp. FACHB-282]|uniref:J domain-containing protein n=1 Tax=Cylindrospermum sp. FACHB-282 TaxID=2692794 RepID=UPI001F5551FF|nr:DnaJ domain-containing protein [Cylindrospermum sp. FACHB-282]